MIIQQITELIGNTPLLHIDPRVHGIDGLTLYMKLECFNPWGSVKDRTAWGMLEDHIEELPNKTLLESSSGNTAKALQMIANIHGSTLRTITNRIKVAEARDVLQLIGTEILELPGKSDCYDPTDPNDPLYFIEREIQKAPGKYLYTDQYRNEKNTAYHYHSTGKEIAEDLPQVDYVIGGLGTTGSTLGIATKLREYNPSLETIGVVAAKEDYIPGIRTADEVMEVGLFEPTLYKHIETVTSPDALEAMRLLIQNTGVLLGPTTGASYQGLLQYFRTHPPKAGSTAVFIACDRVEWYGSYIKERKPKWYGAQQKTSWKDQQCTVCPNTITTQEAVSWIESRQPLIIDLRTPRSFHNGHIKDSINIPFEHLDTLLNDGNPFCTAMSVLFVCPVGEKSHIVAHFLKDQGCNAYSLEGGLAAWNAHGLGFTHH